MKMWNVSDREMEQKAYAWVYRTTKENDAPKYTQSVTHCLELLYVLASRKFDVDLTLLPCEGQIMWRCKISDAKDVHYSFDADIRIAILNAIYFWI